jgi:hypothetical protein
MLAGLVSLLLGLAPGAGPLAGDKAPATKAPEFSDPGQLAEVPADWDSQSIDYELDLRGSDLVVALGQQSHPIFKDVIPEYEKKHNLKIGVRHGTCGITSGRLRKKSAYRKHNPRIS